MTSVNRKWLIIEPDYPKHAEVKSTTQAGKNTGRNSGNTSKVNPSTTVNQDSGKQIITSKTFDSTIDKYKLNDKQIEALNLINENYAKDQKIMNNNPDNPIIFYI